MSPDTITLRPNAAGTYQGWNVNDTTHYGATSDQSDTSYVYVTGSTTLKETENLADTSQTGTINSVTAYMRAKVSGQTTEYTQVTFVGAGTGSGVAGDPTPAYPTGLQANDLILLQVTVRDTTSTVTTPTGFTLLYGPDSTGTGRQWIFYKWSTGTESGTITVDQSGTTCAIGRMYAFRNVAPSSFTEGGGFRYATSATINAQSVTTTGEKRLVVSFVFINDDNTVDSFTGESGGDWVEAVAEFKTTAGSDGCVQLQIATMASAGTISGGSYTMSASDPWGVRAFALIPAGSNPEEKAVILWRTHDTDYESSAITISRTAFTDYSQVRTTNPYTGSAWTWEEVNALQIGSRASTLGSNETIQVSEYWIVVDYTPAVTIFSDGFESGDFSAWTGIQTIQSGQPVVQSTVKHHGTYAMSATIDAHGYYAFVYKNVTSGTNFYTRAYFRFSALPTSTSESFVDLMMMYRASDGFGGLELRVIYDDTAGYARFQVYNNYWGHTYNGPQVVADTWYCVELHHTASGNEEWWVNGVSQGTAGEGAVSMDRFRIGMEHVGGSTAKAVYIDCVVVADAYIGTEGAIYEISLDASTKSLATSSYEITFNIAKDASISSEGLVAEQTTFNLLQDTVVKALAESIIELVSFISIFVDASTQVSSIPQIESTFNVNKDAVINVLTDKILQSIYNINKDAITNVSLDKALQSIFNISKDIVTNVLSEKTVESTFNISKDAIVNVLSDKILESIYNISLNAPIKSLADVEVLLGGFIEIFLDTTVKALSTPLTETQFNIVKKAIVKALTKLAFAPEEVMGWRKIRRVPLKRQDVEEEYYVIGRKLFPTQLVKDIIGKCISNIFVKLGIEGIVTKRVSIKKECNATFISKVERLYGVEGKAVYKIEWINPVTGKKSYRYLLDLLGSDE